MTTEIVDGGGPTTTPRRKTGRMLTGPVIPQDPMAARRDRVAEVVKRVTKKQKRAGK